jgi:enoyl-CoA hydratase
MPAVIVDSPRPGISVLTLHRPERLNAMNTALLTELSSALDELADDHSCRVVVLTGAGRGFCAGIDLRDWPVPPRGKDLGPVPADMALQQFVANVMIRLREIPKPVIAAINGPAAGGGLALACASDIRVCCESARFNAAFVRIGFSGCDVGVSWLLPRIVGTTLAFEMMLSGRLVEADEALRSGLVLEVVPEGQVVEAALEIADRIATNSPFGVWMTKEVMWSNLEVSSFRAAIDLENRTQILCNQTSDAREAQQAFLEKRRADFTFG